MKIFLLITLIIITYADNFHDGGSCGIKAIPYRIEIDEDAKPVISCDSPSCLGIPKSISNSDTWNSESPITCDPFSQTVCSGALQWTSGLMEIFNGTHRTLKTECCSYQPLSVAYHLKHFILKSGDSFIGGQREKGSFDFIKEVRRSVDKDYQLQYFISVYRLPCVISDKKNSKIYQATIQEVEAPIDINSNQIEIPQEAPRTPFRGYPAQQNFYQPDYQPYQPTNTINQASPWCPFSFQCFSGDMEIITDNGKKLIKDLKIGDKVLSIHENLITFSPVIMFLHKRDQEKAVFNEIETTSGKVIKMTDNHLIYVSDCDKEDVLRLLPSKSLKIGNCIHITSDKTDKLIKSKISRISKIQSIGIYSPLTSTGNIIVNDILASCHSNLALQNLQQAFFSIYNRILVFFRGPTGHLPLGVETLTSVLDLFIPQSFV